MPGSSGIALPHALGSSSATNNGSTSPPRKIKAYSASSRRLGLLDATSACITPYQAQHVGPSLFFRVIIFGRLKVNL